MGSDEEQHYRDAFKQFDADGSGKLTLKELTQAVRRCGYRGTDEQLRSILIQGDADDDNELSVDEFVAIMTGQPVKKKTGARMMWFFREYDRDGSGFLDKKELKTIWAEMNKSLDEKEVKRLMELMDPDGDGQIPYEDFIVAYDKL